jgi:hypothetical protein
MTIIILDIDDTLTQGAGAPPQNDAEWNAMFQTAAPNDVLISQFKQKRTLSDIVIVCTGRKEKNRVITEEWLFNIGISHHILLMRDDNDNQVAVNVKRAHYKNIVSAMPHKFVLLIDDDDAVRAMAQQMGIFALHPNDFVRIGAQ